jgi:hypothetical protein
MNGKRLGFLTVIFLLFLAACNLPTSQSVIPPTDIPTDTPGPTATPAPSPSPTQTYSGLTATFTSLADGSSLAGQLDSKGVPVIPVDVDLTGSLLPGTTWPESLVLWIDGLGDSRPFPLTKNVLPQHVEFRTWLSPGKHVLVVHAYNPNHGPDTPRGYQISPTITIDVTGNPVPPVTQRIIQLYQDKFNLKLSDPAISRLDGTTPANSEWISTAYIGDTLYRIYLHDDGKVVTDTVGLGAASGASLCRPSGHYSMLVLFVDYGNTGVNQDMAFTSMKYAQEKQNALNADYSTSLGLTTPILQVETTSAFVPSPPHPGSLLTAADIQAAGYDRSKFDVVAEVDLDTNNTVGTKAPYKGLLGYTSGGCGKAPASPVDIWVVHEKNFDLGWDLSYTLLDHEFFHALGWGHTLPCRQNIFDDYMGDSGTTTFDMCDFSHPPAQFGWEDLNGNGIPEILDPNPYGLTK